MRDTFSVLISFVPLLLFVGIMVIVMRGMAVRTKRCDQHMDRVEELLERVVVAVEREDRPR